MSGTAGCIQVFDLVLTAQAPVFIGDGKTILKRFYLFNKRTHKVSILDEPKFFALLIQKNLVDSYERFMLNQGGSLFDFLTRDCHLSETDWKPAVRYTFDAGAALDAHHALTDIQAFIRDTSGRVYVPGSSVKGALRTILLHQMIRETGPKSTDLKPDERQRVVIPEEAYLHGLKLNRKKQDDMVNSILRGIQVSDSMPVSDENMVLADKWDCQTNGTLKKVPVCRESIQPGTKIHLKLTLDQSVLKGRITRESIFRAIESFDAYYDATYSSRFSQPRSAAVTTIKQCLFLGGGAGFFSKSLIYPYLGEKRGLQETAKIMQECFRQHNHDRDVALGISPHTLKFTKYQGEFCPMGLCKVELQ